VRALLAAIGVMVAVAGANACSGNESPGSTTSTLDEGGVGQATAPAVACYPESYANPAGPITVSIGQQFAVVLLAEPATGYSWQPVAPANPDILLTIGTEFRGPDDGCGISADTQVLRYVGKAPGTAQIALHYSRPAAGAADDKTFTFTIDVVDPNTTTTTAPPIDTGSTDTSTTTTPRSTTTKPRSTTTTKARSTTTTAKGTTTTA
jgi:predicted secreted protein